MSRSASARSCCWCSRCSSRCRGSAYEYVRELERLLRDAQERTLAGTAQAVATALHDRPRLFATPPRPDRVVRARARQRARTPVRRCRRRRRRRSTQILEGLSRTTARIWVVDRDGTCSRARASLKRPRRHGRRRSGIGAHRPRSSATRSSRCIALVLEQPTEDFSDDAATVGAPRGRDVEGALAGILTTDRRRTSRRQGGDRHRRASDLGRRPGARRRGRRGDAQRACSPSATARSSGCSTSCSRSLLVGSLALTLYATWLSSRIRRLRDDAERAIDAQGRVRAHARGLRTPATRSATCRAASRACSRGSPTTRATSEKLASRLSHELRTPIAVVRSSLDNLQGDAAARRRARLHGARAGRARRA